jgi:hypothetical protein
MDREALRAAVDQLAELTSKSVEHVSGLRRREDGWHVTIEVIDLERVPDSTSVMASYEATVDDDGNLLQYERTRRYVRSQTDAVQAEEGGE